MDDFRLLSRTLDEFAGELLHAANWTAPPVDALALAGRLGVEVVLDGRQQARGRHKRLGGRSAIFLRPDPRPERLQWAAAHELGEVCARRIVGRLGLPAEDATAAVREQAANLLAARLLLPRRWFFDDARELDGDVPALKRRYASASHELIALRLLDDGPPGAVSIFDQARLTRRQRNAAVFSARLQPAERRCWREIRRLDAPAEVVARPLRVKGWPVNEQGWRREILWATILNGEDLG